MATGNRMASLLGRSAITTLLVATAALAREMPAQTGDQARDRSHTVAMAPPPGAAPTGAAGAAPGGAPPGPGGGGPPGMGSVADTQYDSALRVRDGKVDAAASTPAAVAGGKWSDTFAQGITITSDKPMFNGVFVQGGPSAFTLSDATIDLSGTGKSDFLGIGAGAMADGGVLILRNAKITTSGAVRSATIAIGNAVMRVYDSTLVAKGGPLPADYVPHIGPGMMEAPPPLKIKGTARTNITMGNSESYFYRSKITADGWGALSTDATGGYVYLEANDCDIQVNNSGYGTYADAGAHVVINGGTLNAATYGGVIAGAGEIRLNNVTGRSGGNVVMIHSVMGSAQESAKLVIAGGNEASTGPAVLVKSANADITLANAGLAPGNGVLVQSIVNDDANRTKVNGAKTPGIVVRLDGGSYTGAIVHDDPERAMRVVLSGATLTGMVRDATVTIGQGGKWTATAVSAVTLAGATDAAAIDAPAGVTITATAGDGTTLRGRYPLAGGGVLAVSG